MCIDEHHTFLFQQKMYTGKQNGFILSRRSEKQKNITFRLEMWSEDQMRRSMYTGIHSHTDAFKSYSNSFTNFYQTNINCQYFLSFFVILDSKNFLNNVILHEKHTLSHTHGHRHLVSLKNTGRLPIDTTICI